MKLRAIQASQPRLPSSSDGIRRSHTKRIGKWDGELAEPLWGLVKDAVNHPPSFEQETNFDPQVAGEMQQDAFLALAFSIIAIMIYIWVRFGNLKYGTATVVALLHDTVFTLAALGLCPLHRRLLAA